MFLEFKLGYYIWRVSSLFLFVLQSGSVTQAFRIKTNNPSTFALEIDF